MGKCLNGETFTHSSKAHLTKVPKMGRHVLSVCSSFLALPTSVMSFGTAVCGGLITHVASFFFCKEEVMQSIKLVVTGTFVPCTEGN